MILLQGKIILGFLKGEKDFHEQAPVNEQKKGFIDLKGLFEESF